MQTLVIVVVLLVLVAGGFYLFNRLRSTPEAERARNVMRSRRQEDAPAVREPTVSTLEPGDAVAFGDGTNAVVETVLECREQVGPRTTAWRWSFLDDRKLLESAPDGNVLYDRSEVAYQGGEMFQRLVAEADQGGILKTFEQRVRAGTVASEPLTFEHAGLTFHMRSTGTFTAVARGKPLDGVDVWQDVSPEAGDNVYFEAEARSGEQLLGVWTSHILLLVGQPLGITDIDAIYPGAGGTA